MTTINLNASANFDAPWSQDTDFATMQAGATLQLLTKTDCRVGQRLISTTKHGYQTCLEFDTSAIAAGDTITAVALKVYLLSNDSTTDFTLRAYVYDYGATVDTGDWRTPAQLSGYLLAGHVAIVSQGVGLLTLTDDNLIASINKTGKTRYVLVSDRFVAGTAPTNQEYITVDGDNTNGTPSTLDVTYTPAAPAARQPFIGGGFF